jgi:acetyl-CoA C-acetyltransferase
MANAAYIFDAVRTPRGRGKTNGSLYTVKAVDLLATSLRALAERNNLREKANSALIDDVSIGCVTQTGEQGRASPARACCSRISTRPCPASRSTASAARASRPSTTPRPRWPGLRDLTCSAAAWRACRGWPMGSDGGALWDPHVRVALRHRAPGHLRRPAGHPRGFTREDVDQFALRSQRRPPPPWERGAFSRSVVPVRDRTATVLARGRAACAPTPRSRASPSSRPPSR